MEQNPASPADGPAQSRGRSAVLVLAGTAVSVLVLDQAAKLWAVAALSDGSRWDLIPGLLWFHLARNSGAAFSLATGYTWIFTVIALAVSLVIIRLIPRLGSPWWGLALGLLLGGAVGNLVDRLFRSPGLGRGWVVDFIAVPHYPVFNIADSGLVVAAMLIAVLGLRGIALDGSRQHG